MNRIMKVARLIFQAEATWWVIGFSTVYIVVKLLNN